MKKYFFLGLFFLALLTPSFASYITLEPTVSLEAVRNNLRLELTVINEGDESAYNVQAELCAPGRTILARKQAELPTGSVYKINETIPVNLGQPGIYPLILVMHYTDANLYPFSALTAKTFTYKKELVSPLFGVIQSLVIAKEGLQKFSVKNSSEQGLDSTITLFVPSELTVFNKTFRVVLPPRSEKSVEFKLKNFSALPGSTYQVFAVTTFESGGIRGVNIAPGTVKVIESNILVQYKYYFIALIVLLFLLFIVLQLKK